jgi:hypothetical protein
MIFAAADILNLLALLISMAGSFLMFYFSPEVNSQTFVYNDDEQQEIIKSDARKNKLTRRGMLLLLIGFILQAAAIFVSVANK